MPSVTHSERVNQSLAVNKPASSVVLMASHWLQCQLLYNRNRKEGQCKVSRVPPVVVVQPETSWCCATGRH